MPNIQGIIPLSNTRIPKPKFQAAKCQTVAAAAGGNKSWSSLKSLFIFHLLEEESGKCQRNKSPEITDKSLLSPSLTDGFS